MSQTAPKKNYLLYSLAIALLALAAVILLFAPHYSAIRALPGMACLAAMYLFRISNVHRPQSLANVTIAGVGFEEEKRQRRILWIISLALVPALAIAILLMYIDAANGGNETWPVYVLAGVLLACVGAWSGLAAKIFG